jgi:hypothetical protein
MQTLYKLSFSFTAFPELQGRVIFLPIFFFFHFINDIYDIYDIYDVYIYIYIFNVSSQLYWYKTLG